MEWFYRPATFSAAAVLNAIKLLPQLQPNAAAPGDTARTNANHFASCYIILKANAKTSVIMRHNWGLSLPACLPACGL